MSVHSLLKSTCTIERPQVIIQSDGSVNRTYTEVARDVPCSIHRLVDEETRTVSGHHERIAAHVYVMRGTDVRPVIRGNGGDCIVANGQRFFVMAIRDEVNPHTPVRTLLVQSPEAITSSS